MSSNSQTNPHRTHTLTHTNTAVPKSSKVKCFHVNPYLTISYKALTKNKAIRHYRKTAGGSQFYW